MGLGLILVKRFVGKSALVCLVVSGLWSILATGQTSALAGSTPAATSAAAIEHDPLVDAAFEHFYNLEYDQALAGFVASPGGSLRSQSPAEYCADARTLSHGRDEFRRIRER